MSLHDPLVAGRWSLGPGRWSLGVGRWLGVRCGARRGQVPLPRCNHDVRGVMSRTLAVRSHTRHRHYTGAVVGVVKGVFPRLHSIPSFGRGL